MGPKWNHKSPYKRVVEGDFTTHRRRPCEDRPERDSKILHCWPRSGRKSHELKNEALEAGKGRKWILL